MKISTKTEYGVRALIYMGERQNDGALSLTQIAQDLEISLFFLEKIFSDLKSAGIVSSSRGKKGGYTLQKPMNEVLLSDIVRILESNELPLASLASQDNCNKMHCKSHVVLTLVQNKILESLSSVRLADLCNHKV